jgi:PAS domain S-box-containing protein
MASINSSSLLADIAFRIRASLSLENILQTTVQEVRQLLKVERVLIYHFDHEWSGQVTVESVSKPEFSILGRIIKDKCFDKNWLKPYHNGCTKVINNIHEVGFSNCHIEFLNQIQVKSNLIVPILVDNSLWGLLIAHSCINIRQWQADEVELLEQLAVQVANAIQQANLLEKVQISNLELEAKVAQRTRELEEANQLLQQELIRTQKAEAALRKRDAIVRSFYDSAPMMMGVVELINDDILHLSDNFATAQFFGTTPEAMQNKTASQLGIHIDLIHIWLSNYRQSQRTGKPVWFEYQHLVDREIKWLSATVSYIGLSDNNRPMFSYCIDDISDRKLAQADKVYLSNLLEASLNEIYVFDAETLKFKYVNQGGLKNLGYSLPQMQEMTPLDIKPNITAEKFQSLITPLLTGEKEIIQIQTSHQRADGSTYLAEAHLQLMEQWGKKVFLAVILDITQRYETEQKLKFQAQLLSQVKDAVVAVDISHRVINWNIAAEKLYGITATAAIGKPLSECYEYLWLKPEDENNANQTLANVGFWQGENIHRKLNGEEIFVESSVTILKDEEGNNIGLLALIRDITERRLLENERQQVKTALQKSEQQYRRIVETTTEGIWILDSEGKTSFVNPQMSAMLGYSDTEMQGRHLLEFMDEKEQKIALKYLERRQQGIQEKHDFKFCRRDGSNLWAIVSTRAIHDIQGKYIGALAMLTDITDRKQAEEELKLKNLALEEAKQQAEAANQAKTEFLANMSHEIRTPMNAILGFADLLESEIKQPPISSYIQSINSSGKTLLALINDILDLSKIEAGKLELYYEPIDLRVLTQEIIEIFTPHANEKNIFLHSTIEDQVPKAIYIDEIRLRQILFNVVGNALKFTEEGYVHISIRGQSYWTDREEKVWLEIAIEDTGIGIRRDQQKRIFDAFIQSAGQSNRKYGGTGLGLAITKRLMNMMGGIITLQSELQKGSIFTFVFPAISPAQNYNQIVTTDQKDSDFNQLPPSTILVADDIYSNRELIQAYFHQTHHQVLFAENGQQVIDLAYLHHPDLILLDIRMPIMDGKETAKLLKQDDKTKNIPIVIITASSQINEKNELLQIAQGFLSKPFNCKELFTELRKNLQIDYADNSNQLNCQPHENTINTEELKLRPVAVNLQELLNKLQSQKEMVWHDLMKTLTLRDLKQFTTQLKTWGEEHQCQLLLDYVNTLQTKLDNFDMEQVPLIVEQFTVVQQSIKSLK